MKYNLASEILGGFSLVFAMAASLWLALWPYFYSYTSTSVSAASGAPETVHGAASLVELNGAGALLPLAAPVALAALAFAFAHARWRVSPLARRLALWTVGVLLPVFCVLASFSIGAFYVPAAALSLAAAVASTVGRRPEGKTT